MRLDADATSCPRDGRELPEQNILNADQRHQHHHHKANRSVEAAERRDIFKWHFRRPRLTFNKRFTDPSQLRFSSLLVWCLIGCSILLLLLLLSAHGAECSQGEKSHRMLASLHSDGSPTLRARIIQQDDVSQIVLASLPAGQGPNENVKNKPTVKTLNYRRPAAPEQKLDHQHQQKQQPVLTKPNLNRTTHKTNNRNHILPSLAEANTPTTMVTNNDHSKRKTNRLGEFSSPADDYDLGFDLSPHSNPPPMSDNNERNFDNQAEQNHFLPSLDQRNTRAQGERSIVPPPLPSSSSLMAPTLPSMQTSSSALRPFSMKSSSNSGGDFEQWLPDNNNARQRNWNGQQQGQQHLTFTSMAPKASVAHAKSNPDNAGHTEDTMESSRHRRESQSLPSDSDERGWPAAQELRADNELAAKMKPSSTNRIISGERTRGQASVPVKATITQKPVAQLVNFTTPNQPRSAQGVRSPGGSVAASWPSKSKFSALLSAGSPQQQQKKLQLQRTALASPNSTVNSDGNLKTLTANRRHPKAPVFQARARLLTPSIGSMTNATDATSRKQAERRLPSGGVKGGAHNSRQLDEAADESDEGASGRGRDGRDLRRKIENATSDDNNENSIVIGPVADDQDQSLKIFSQHFKYTIKARKQPQVTNNNHNDSQTKTTRKKLSLVPVISVKPRSNRKQYLNGVAPDEIDDEQEDEDGEENERSSDGARSRRRASTTTKPINGTLAAPSPAASERAATTTIEQKNWLRWTVPIDANNQDDHGLSRRDRNGTENNNTGSYTVYDLTDEHSGSSSSEYRTNYTQAIAPAGNDNRANSTSANTKTSTKRRDTRDKLRVSVGGANGGPANEASKRLIQELPLLIRFSPQTASRILNQKIQSKQDSSWLTTTLASNHRQPAINVTSQQWPQLTSVSALPLVNYAQQSQVGDAAAAHRASIVRSGFLVPTGATSASSSSSSFHNLRALAAPAAMALLAHAQGASGSVVAPNNQQLESSNLDRTNSPLKQLRALSQIKALLASHHQHHSHSHQLVDSILPVTSSNIVDYSIAAVPPASSKLSLTNQSNTQQQQLDQMLATSNQLGVSHLGPHQAAHIGLIPAASGELVLQDYPLEPPPVPSRDSRDQIGQQSTSQQQQTQVSGGGGGPAADQQPNGNSNQVSANDQGPEDEHQHRSRLSDNYGPDFGHSSSSSSSLSSNSQQANENSPQYQYFESASQLASSNPRASSPNSSSSSSQDYYTSAYENGPLTRSSDYYLGPGRPDPYEDLASPSLSTSEFENDLADLDEEFNRQVYSRPLPARPNSSGLSPSNLMSDSMLTYSPDRYSDHYSHHHHHHHHRPSSQQERRPSQHQAHSHAYETYGSGSGSSLSSSMASDFLRPYHGHHHNQRVAAATWPSTSNSGLDASAANSGMWPTDSAFDFSPLASPFLPPTSPSSSSASSRWRPPRFYHQPLYSHHAHPSQMMPVIATPQPRNQLAASPYFTTSYLGGATTGASEQPAFSLIPGYAANLATGGSTAALPTETVSFTISPLAAAAAAAATALAAADKARHHHSHHAWTFTLPRLASTLAQAAASSSGSSQQASSQVVAASAPQASTITLQPFHQAYTGAGQYHRPAAAAAASPSSYLFSPFAPIYAIAPTTAARPAGASATLPHMATAASGAAPSVVPIHAFQANQPQLIAYRPATSLFAAAASAPLLTTSFAYPFRMPLTTAGLPAVYHPLSLGGGGSHSAATNQHHHHQDHMPVHYYTSAASRPSSSSASSSSSSSGSGRPSSSLLASATTSALKPFYADLQFAESTKSKLNNGQSGGLSSSKGGLAKTTASGLTQMARNLTKKMFGSASQVRPHFVAPPANLELISAGLVSAASSSAVSPAPSLASTPTSLLSSGVLSTGHQATSLSP